jgi:DivIVA domain-containing protein
MALTPEDVVNKRFQPTKFREGYDQDEVDDFLDEVVVELRRLGQENDDLKQQLAAAGGHRPKDQGAVTPEPSEAAEAVAAPKPASHSAAESHAAEAASTPSAAAATPIVDEAESANNLLQLARRLHDEHVRDGQEKRDALIAEGQETAARIIAEAETQQQEQISRLESQRTQLEGRIDELRTFERDYRTQLRSYIEGQLRELDSDKQNRPSSRPSASAREGGNGHGGAQQGAFQGFSA